MKKGLNIKVNVNTIVELTKKNKALEDKVKLLEKEKERDNKWIAGLEKKVDSVNAHFAHPLKGNLTVDDWKNIKKFKE